jgi:hypothetical protein
VFQVSQAGRLRMTGFVGSEPVQLAGLNALGSRLNTNTFSAKVRPISGRSGRAGFGV